MGERSEQLICDISIVDRLLSQPESKIWYDSYQGHLDCDNNRDQYNKNFKLLLISVDVRLPEYTGADFQRIFYRIAQFKFELMPDFSFYGDIDVPSISRQEITFTGDEVLNFKSDCRRVEFNNAADLFGDRDSYYNFAVSSNSFRSIIQEGSEINAKPDNWKRIILRLYLSESMHYHLWIRLDDFYHVDNADYLGDLCDEQFQGINDEGLVRNIVIKDLCRMNFLKEIEIIRKWCGCSSDFNGNIKREVAKVGGYVPGAEVL